MDQTPEYAIPFSIMSFSHEEGRIYLLGCISRIKGTQPGSTYRILEEFLRAGTEIKEQPSVVL